MTGEQFGILVTFVAYLVALFVIGWLGERRHGDSYEDFVSADKSLGSIVTAISSASSSESVWVMLGLSGIGYWKGVAGYWAAIGCIVGFSFNAAFIAPRLRRDSGRLGALTLSDYLTARTGDRGNLIRLLSALIITVFMLAYVVAQFSGAGKLLVGMELFGPDTPYWVGVVLGAVIVGIYIVMGGYAAVCWTDTLQGGLMFLVMLGLPVLAVARAGGFAGVAEVLGPLGLLSLRPAETAGWALAGFVLGNLGIALGYPGMPHMIVRYITAADEREARRAGWIAVVWAAVVLFGSTTVGLGVRALAPDLAGSQDAAEQAVLPFLTRSHMHPVLAGMVLSAVTAAIMSTADSQLMYAATSLIHDFWLKVRPRSVSDDKLVVRTRLILVGMTAVAMVFALVKPRFIFTFVLFAWSALGAAFTPVILLSLYWRKLTRSGVLAALVVGPAVTVIWKRVPPPVGELYELIPAFLLSLGAAVAVSLLTWRSEGAQASPPEAAAPR